MTPPPPARAGGVDSPPASGGGPVVEKAYATLPTQRSRELRNNPTPAERKLWNALSNRKLCSTRFNRQVVIRPYICDFVARSAKLIVEVDGGQHGDAIAYDRARTAFLKAKGYRLIRFWNNDVLSNLEGVVTTIEQALEFSPPARAGGVDSPQASGGGHVISGNDRPSPPRLRRSSPPAPAGGGQKA